jgi:hypothetical protein
MTGVFSRKPFSGKNMPKMAATICTGNFYTSPVNVSGFLNCSGYFVVETWPAATRMKLI